MVTLDLASLLIKNMVLRKDGKSDLADNHFAQVEGIREESTLLLRNFYKVGFSKVPYFFFYNHRGEEKDG